LEYEADEWRDFYANFFKEESQLILTVQDLAADLDKGQQIDAVLLDFSKAFDKVPHRRLLLKLHHSGVRSGVLSNLVVQTSQRYWYIWITVFSPISTCFTVVLTLVW
jgi:hypothetical protein